MADRGRPRSFDRDVALARAMDVFWDKGYQGASMAELTTAMGIGSPSLYAAFGSKEDLFRASVARYKARDGSAIWAPLGTAPTAVEAVRGVLMASARAFSRPKRPRGCLIVLSALHADEMSETVRRELIRLRAGNAAQLSARIRRGMEAGEIAAGADPDMIANYYVTVQQGMSIQARDGAGRAILETIAKAALAAWGPLTGSA
ncbi:transcriptional regulator, TetR family [Rhizobiales bacterium GAS191]|nr:transcriptional regulator, TetR family [Rhizobiales bacterium GAS191]